MVFLCRVQPFLTVVAVGSTPVPHPRRQCFSSEAVWHVPKSSSQRSSGGTVVQERSKIIIIVNLRCCHRDAGVETDACHSCSSCLFS